MTLVIEDRDGKRMQVSAVAHQDPHCLCANRIALIGARDKEIELLGLKTDSVIEWRSMSGQIGRSATTLSIAVANQELAGCAQAA